MDVVIPVGACESLVCGEFVGELGAVAHEIDHLGSREVPHPIVSLHSKLNIILGIMIYL